MARGKKKEKILTPEEKLQGHWPDEFISTSGLFVRQLLLEQPIVLEEEEG